MGKGQTAQSLRRQCVIVLYAHKGFSGAHYIAGIRSKNTSKEDHRFRFYNNDFKYITKLRSISDVIVELKAMGEIPLLIWGIRK